MRRNIKPLEIPLDYIGLVTIRTQQGFSQHELQLTPSDAVSYTDLLNKYDLWWADVTRYTKPGNNEGIMTTEQFWKDNDEH